MTTPDTRPIETIPRDVGQGGLPATAINTILDQTRAMQLGPGPVSSGGVHIISAPGHAPGVIVAEKPIPSFLAEVVERGPEDEEDFDDENYWAVQLFPSSTGASETLGYAKFDPDKPRGRIFKFTNLDEALFETHAVPHGTIVHIVRAYDQTPLATEKFYTIGTGAGNQVRFGLIREIPPDNRSVIVQLIKPVVPGFAGTWELHDGDWVPVWMFPGFSRRHYEAMVTQHDMVDEQIIPVVLQLFHGYWHAWPIVKRAPVLVGSNATFRMSDCSPVPR